MSYRLNDMKKNSLPPPTADLAAAIVGVWKLKSREDVDETGKVHLDPFLGRDPVGILCFGKTHFSAQFMKRDRSGDEKTVPQAVDAKNNTARLNGYDAYFGTYTVDEIKGTLTTRLDGAISPSNIGDTYVRDVRVMGDELIVQLETTTIDGIPITRTNTFSRVA